MPASTAALSPRNCVQICHGGILAANAALLPRAESLCNRRGCRVQGFSLLGTGPSHLKQSLHSLTCSAVAVELLHQTWQRLLPNCPARNWIHFPKKIVSWCWCSKGENERQTGLFGLPPLLFVFGFVGGGGALSTLCPPGHPGHLQLLKCIGHILERRRQERAASSSDVPPKKNGHA